MCVMQMQFEGLTVEQARQRVFLINSKGLITKNSPVVKPEHQKYAKDVPHIKDLLEIIETVRPTGLIGASTVRGAFTEQIIRKMAELNERPIIFALSNPTSKSECTAEEAFRYTEVCTVHLTSSVLLASCPAIALALSSLRTVTFFCSFELKSVNTLLKNVSAEKFSIKKCP
ncbi:unnamed protein product [Gongylonema pulchrum]|uniref:Malic_M domain-containing protein n=1 Tax=Gongylonema pulchrum TaxID=637853 RepID=A0A183DL11_9BILA|nr:unnamed protein product [Gongylonema pulchrum]